MNEYSALTRFLETFKTSYILKYSVNNKNEIKQYRKYKMNTTIKIK